MGDRNKKLKVMFKRYLRNNNKDAPPLTAAPPAPPEVCTLIKTDMTNVAQVRKIEDEEKEEFESVQGGCKPAISRAKKSKPLKWKFGSPDGKVGRKRSESEGIDRMPRSRDTLDSNETGSFSVEKIKRRTKSRTKSKTISRSMSQEDDTISEDSLTQDSKEEESLDIEHRLGVVISENIRLKAQVLRYRARLRKRNNKIRFLTKQLDAANRNIEKTATRLREAMNNKEKSVATREKVKIVALPPPKAFVPCEATTSSESVSSPNIRRRPSSDVKLDDKTFETAVSVLTVLKRNQLMERSLTFAETTTIAKFFSGNSEKPDEKIVKILDKAIGNALFVLANRPNEVDDVIDNQMRSFVMDPDKAKTVLLEVMLSRSEFVPISWGGKGGDYIPDQKSKAVKRSSKTKTKDKAVDKPADKTLDETVDDSDDQKKANAKKNNIKAHTPERKKKSDTKSKSETKISPANSGTNSKTKK